MMNQETRSALLVMIEQANEPAVLVTLANDVAKQQGDTEDVRSAIRDRASTWPADQLKPGDLATLDEATKLAHSNRATVHSVAKYRLAPPISRY